jgi:hypothetical protein
MISYVPVMLLLSSFMGLSRAGYASENFGLPLHAPMATPVGFFFNGTLFERDSIPMVSEMIITQSKNYSSEYRASPVEINCMAPYPTPTSTANTL